MEQVSNYAAANGVLIMPIVDECAYRNTHDESTAFGTEFEKNTAAHRIQCDYEEACSWGGRWLSSVKKSLRSDDMLLPCVAML